MLWLEWRRWCCGLGGEGGVVAWVEKVVLWVGWKIGVVAWVEKVVLWVGWKIGVVSEGVLKLRLMVCGWVEMLVLFL